MSSLLPSPSCPSTPRPQLNTWPSSVTAMLWRQPLATCRRGGVNVSYAMALAAWPSVGFEAKGHCLKDAGRLWEVKIKGI